ncbi:cupin domain-containing protein [Stigmatella erecta]|uniref:Mannose-6-phosphate isomerase, cupin superfamily n=1 Tax=Stigmatella erecta TaxID=83460 RepID=A0A1I0KDD3_9BACT|nr:cupin domain-containing protein [Stigmatella erecta]SEU21437.1 Mannose-6-phosphate isomerase, cupin superfamily [Stigmatella erecta]
MRSDGEAPPTLGIGTAARGESCWRPRWDWRRASPDSGAETNTAAESPLEPTVEKVNLESKFSLFSEHWKPKVVGELNGQQVKLAKLSGSFVWHHHEAEDELFLVVKGRLRIELRDRTVALGPGEFLIIPRGVEHRPVAEGEVEVLLFEPSSTLNTGNVRDERTAGTLEHL